MYLTKNIVLYCEVLIYKLIQRYSVFFYRLPTFPLFYIFYFKLKFLLVSLGGSTVGYEEEQAQDELREAVAGSPLLLRQEHHTQDHRQKVRQAPVIFVFLQFFFSLKF